MNIKERAIAQLASLESVFGFNPSTVEQRSEQWRMIKLGVLSASKADKIVAGTKTEGRASYMAELIDQIITCKADESGQFKQTEWGNKYEPEARYSLSAALGFIEIDEIPFIYLDDSMRVGVSPDGVYQNTVFEIKAPFDGSNHVKHCAFEMVKPEWKWQRQFQIYGANAERHIFATYDPRVVLGKNLHYTETEVDEKMQATIRDAVPQFISDMDKALANIGVKFGDHWNYLKNNF